MKKILSQTQIAALFRAYHAAKIAADKAKDIGAEIKALMKGMDTDKLEAGGFIATCSEVKTKRFDTKRFAEEHPDLYAQYLVEATTERLNFK